MFSFELPILCSSFFRRGLLVAVCWTVALGTDAARSQLTLSNNQLWRQEDLDAIGADEGALFGTAVAVCDFDGDGYDDLAIGAPRTDVFAFAVIVEDAGAAYVIYGGPNGLTTSGAQILIQPIAGEDPPEEDDEFGRELVGGDFNGDGWCDLAVGAELEDVDGNLNAGSVHVFSGSAGGVSTTSQVWSQDSPGVLESAEALDFFGSSLAAADFDNDGYADLAIGVRGESLGAALNAGVVHVLFGTGEGLTGTQDDLIYQGDSLGTWGEHEDNDRFGSRLAVGLFNGDAYPDLAVGTGAEDFDGAFDAGRVQVFYPDELRFVARNQADFDQGSLDAGSAVETGDLFGRSLTAGDFDGDGLDDLAVGSWEGVGLPGAEADSAGSVAILRGTTAGLTGTGSQVWTQDTPGISDSAEEEDEFGGAIAAGDFDGDNRDDLAIGVPWEDFENGGHVDNGAVHALYGAVGGLATEGEQYHGQTVWGAGQTQSQDLFGWELATGDFDGDGVSALVVGVPFENVGGEVDAGAVVVITGVLDEDLFEDGFESGDLSAWGVQVP